MKEKGITMRVMKVPVSVDIDITNRCNLRCKHCYYYSSEGETSSELSTDEWLQFFRELRDCTVLSVTLAGGEPFIREDFRQLVTGIVENRMRFSILSNGTLITDDLARFLSSTGRCDSVQVSIDGSCADVHDRLRGPGSFDRAVAGIGHLQKHGIPVAVRVTVHRGNVSDLERIAVLLLDELGIAAFSTNAASHMGLCRSHCADVQLDIADRTEAMRLLADLELRYPGRITATAGPLADVHFFAKMEQARLEGRERLDGKGFLTGCGCIFNTLAVRADGVIVPCPMLSHIELGKVNSDSLKEVWQTHPVLQSMRVRNRIPLSSFAYCEGCEYMGYCTGNCPALSYTTFGVIDHPSPDGCFRRFLEQGGQLPEMAACSINC